LLEQHNRNSSTIEKMVENNIGLKQKNDRTNFELGESKKREESLNRKIANMTGKTEELMSQRAKFQAKSEQLEKDRNRSHQENGELINRNQTIMNEIRELLNQWRKDLPKVTEMPDSKSLKVRAKLHLSSKSLKNLLPGYAYWVVDDYNTLANNLTDIINELNEKLRNIENFK
jgi:chromosome segregation ATPase